MRKRINHWCSVVQWFQKASFELTHWNCGPSGWDFFCPRWTPMMDSIYLTYPYQPVGKIKKRTAPRPSHASRISAEPWPHVDASLESPYHLAAVSGAHFTQGTILIVILVSSGSAKSRTHQFAVGGFLVT